MPHRPTDLRTLMAEPSRIFGYFDLEKLGSITFRQFLIGSAQIRKQPLFWRACETAFNKCRDNNTDQISEIRLGDITQSIFSPSTSGSSEHLFHILDIDGDGRISRDDFMTCLRKNPLLIGLFAVYMKYES